MNGANSHQYPLIFGQSAIQKDKRRKGFQDYQKHIEFICMGGINKN